MRPRARSEAERLIQRVDGTTARRDELLQTIGEMYGLSWERPEEALSMFNSLPEDLREDRFLLTWRAHVARSVDDETFLAATKDLERLFPDDDATHFLEYEICVLEGRHAEAITALKSLQRGYADPFFDVSLGQHYFELDDLDEAARYRDRALAEEPGLLDARILALDLALRAEDPSEAVNTLVYIRDQLGKSLDDELFEAVRDTGAFRTAVATPSPQTDLSRSTKAN